MNLPLRIPMKTCSCGALEDVIPTTAKYHECPDLGGYYWNCITCHSTFFYPEAKLPLARELCDCSNCSEDIDRACAFDCHEHADIGKMCRGCLEIEINRSEVRDEIERVMGRK